MNQVAKFFQTRITLALEAHRGDLYANRTINLKLSLFCWQFLSILQSKEEDKISCWDFNPGPQDPLSNALPLEPPPLPLYKKYQSVRRKCISSGGYLIRTRPLLYLASILIEFVFVVAVVVVLIRETKLMKPTEMD